MTEHNITYNRGPYKKKYVTSPSIRQKALEYYNKNIDAIKQRKAVLKESIHCDTCNCDIKKFSYHNHCSTIKHKRNNGLIPADDKRQFPERKNQAVFYCLCCDMSILDQSLKSHRNSKLHKLLVSMGKENNFDVDIKPVKPAPVKKVIEPLPKDEHEPTTILEFGW